MTTSIIFASTAIALLKGDRFLPTNNNNGTAKYLHLPAVRTAADD
jgi:hypothetical protein